MPASQQQTDDGQQLRCDQGKENAQDGGGNDADQNGLRAVLFRQASGGKPDDDGVVARKHKVNRHNLQQGSKPFGVNRN